MATEVFAELRKLGRKLRDFFLQRGEVGGSELTGLASPEQRALRVSGGGTSRSCALARPRKFVASVDVALSHASVTVMQRCGQEAGSSSFTRHVLELTADGLLPLLPLFHSDAFILCAELSWMLTSRLSPVVSNVVSFNSFTALRY